MKIKFLFASLILYFSKSCPDEDGCINCKTLKYEPYSKCDFCYNGFSVPENGNCERKHLWLIDNCLTYHQINLAGITETFCMICDFGFYLTEDFKSCKPCSADGCAICKNDICGGCFDNRKLKYFEDPKTGPQCTIENKCDLENCSVCETTDSGKREVCAFCAEGFTLDLQNFSECFESKIKNCQTVKRQKDKSCLNCDFGYHLTLLGGCAKDHPKEQNLGYILILFLTVISMGIYLFYLTRNNSKDEFSETLLN